MFYNLNSLKLRSDYLWGVTESLGSNSYDPEGNKAVRLGHEADKVQCLFYTVGALAEIPTTPGWTGGLAYISNRHVTRPHT